jgi:hypothetical protein
MARPNGNTNAEGEITTAPWKLARGNVRELNGARRGCLPAVSESVGIQEEPGVRNEQLGVLEMRPVA